MDTVSASIVIPFPDALQATLVYNVLRVDKEPPRSGVTKILTVEDNFLKVSFEAKLYKQLRVALTSFFETLTLIVETIEFAGPPIFPYSYL